MWQIKHRANPSPSCSPSYSTRGAGRNQLPGAKSGYAREPHERGERLGDVASSSRDEMTITSPRRKQAPLPFFQAADHARRYGIGRKRASEKRRGKEQQHATTARTLRNDNTPCGHENTIPRRKHRPLPAPRIARRGERRRADDLTAYGMTTRTGQAQYPEPRTASGQGEPTRGQ